jgi:peroxiredoxin
MSYLQIGSIIIRTEWIILFVVAIIGFATAGFRLHKYEHRKQMLDVIFNAFLIGLFVWKGSIAFFQPIEVINNPMALLYFTGGSKGVWLGLIVGAVYIAFQSRKYQLNKFVTADAVLLGLMSSSASMIFLELILELDVSFLEYVILLIGILVYILLTLLKEGVVKMGKMVLIFIVIGLASWSVYDYLLQPQSEETKVEIDDVPVVINVGEQAPNFALNTLTGEEIELTDLRGNTVVLNIWATWCPPCQAEMPEMVKFYEEHSEQDIEILAINMTNSEKNIENVETFNKEYELNFPVLLDQQGEIASVYKAFTIPTTYIIDENGIIVGKIAGPMSYEWMEKHILSR